MLKTIPKKKFGRLKLLFLLVISALLTWQLYKHPISWALMEMKISEIETRKFIISLFAILFLMVLNWFLEAYKWKETVKTFENISFGQAIKGVLMGLSLGAFTPFMSGDFLARTMTLKNKTLGLIANGFCSGMQTLTSLLFGFFALIYMANSYYFEKNKFLIILFCILIGLVLFFAFYIIYLPKKFLRFLPKKIRDESLFFLKTSFLLKILILSIIRNVIFSIQFIISLTLFSVNMKYDEMFWGTQFTFLFKTIGGGLNLIGDIIIRQYSAIEYFNKYGIATETIMLSTFLIWLINIVFPMLVGLIFVNNFKHSEWK